MGKQLSIHGRDKSGKLDSERYNPNPQEPKLPTTARGKRRAAVKAARKEAAKSAKAK